MTWSEPSKSGADSKANDSVISNWNASPNDGPPSSTTASPSIPRRTNSSRTATLGSTKASKSLGKMTLKAPRGSWSAAAWNIVSAAATGLSAPPSEPPKTPKVSAAAPPINNTASAPMRPRRPKFELLPESCAPTG